MPPAGNAKFRPPDIAKDFPRGGVDIAPKVSAITFPLFWQNDLECREKIRGKYKLWVSAKSFPVFRGLRIRSSRVYHGIMSLTDTHPELPLVYQSPSDTVIINARCTLRQEGQLRMVCVAGLPMHHWADGDRMAEAYAMLCLVRCGYAKQSEVAQAFGYTTRTLRNHRRRYEAGGMSALGKSSCRPQGTRAQPSPWIGTAIALKRNGMGVREIAQRLKISKTTVGKWLARTRQAFVRSVEASPQPKIRSPARTSVDSVMSASVHSASNANVQGWSLDTDPSNRMFDRRFARMGLLEDATPLFIAGRRVSHGGVLLAVPALVQSGIFSAAKEVYGRIGPAFYGLRTTILAMLLMALLRVKRPEGLKEHAPTDVGRIMGLDRAPEVKTLRRKLADLAATGKAELFVRKLAQMRVAKRGAMMGFLYMDGHVRVYHGRRRIAKAYATRMRLALPATTDYWINDKGGDPVFVVTAEANEGLVAMLPKLLQEVRSLVGKKRRVTVVFDRGGWSPKLFLKLIQSGFDILTYRKGRWTEIPRTQFQRYSKKIEGRKVAYELNDKKIRLLKGKLCLRQITRLSSNGHQTPIVTSRRDLSAVEVAYRMFERWRQENFFKYMREEYEFDAMADYAVDPENPERSIPNPERRKIDKKLGAARAKLRKLEALYGEAAMSNKEGKRSTIRGFKIAHGKLGQQIRELQKRIDVFRTQRSLLPERVTVKELSGEPLVRLSRERKHLTNCIKMVAYNAESDLLALVRPHYARADAEGRTLITTALQTPADLDVGKEILRVTLASLSSEHRSKAIASMCESLNQMKVRFPGTKLRLTFAVAQTAS